MNAGVRQLARISVRGVVQGVGFRPFVFRLAKEHKLNGWVRNTSGKVEIEVEGDGPVLQQFLKDLESQSPPMARIEKVEVVFSTPKGYADFQIHQSLSQAGEYQLVSPDIATCKDCQREIFSPGDRRYRYPFTNCTNCGPRFTIIEDIPYDRPRTTMRKFRMCPECQREYDDPLDRRFHAQPNACPKCGPGLELVDGEGKPVNTDDAIKSVSDLLKADKLVAIRGLGGFHLACDATSETAVKLMRRRKGRPSKPFAVMMPTLDDIKKHCLVSPEEEKLLDSPQCPIVLLPWKRKNSSI
ncbi:MAG: acylphosphatase, partial [Chloroflexota bacterium]|nr:acylphosphatase [Chloroflexota bacterium]